MKGPNKNLSWNVWKFFMISHLRNFPVFSNRYRDPPNPWKITCILPCCFWIAYDFQRFWGRHIFSSPQKKSFFHGVSSPESWMILKLQDFGVRFGISLAFPGGPIFRWSIVKLGGGFKCFLCSPRKLEKISNSTNIFQMGWNHQLVNFRGVNVHPVKMLIVGDSRNSL